MGRHSLGRVFAHAWVLLVATDIGAQCETRWLPGAGWAGLNTGAAAMTNWDPDGPGPEPEILVVGGQFTTVGNLRIPYLAIYDARTEQWRPLGPELNGSVSSLAVLQNGDLVVGGSFWWPCHSRPPKIRQSNE